MIDSAPVRVRASTFAWAPSKVSVLLMATDSLYKPAATLIVSPEEAFPIAALIVLHAVAGERQSLASLPVVELTYQGPAARVVWPPKNMRPRTSVKARADKTASFFEFIDLSPLRNEV